MRLFYLLIINMLFATAVQAQPTKSINATAGNLAVLLTAEELTTLTDLTVTGTIDARDFRTIHDEMPLLEILDISEVSIVAFTDTTFGNNILHPADAIPFGIFEWNDSPQTSYALSGHTRLSDIKLPASLRSIGYRAFFSCTGLTTVEMQSSVSTIGNEAFLNCSSLTSINLPLSVTSIGEKAFQSCINLASIDLPPALKKIDYYTFADCKALKTIIIPPSVNSIVDNAFTGCSELQSVGMPSSITVIRNEVFKDCISLIAVEVPSMVTLIKEFAFRGCSALRTLSLSESLSAIEPAAFSDCISLDTIYSHAINPPDLDNPGGWDVFDKVDKTSCLLFVPMGSKEDYASAFGWKDFENIVEMAQFSLDTTNVTLEAEENSVSTIKLHSSLSWTATSDQEWLSVTPLSGSGGQQLTFTAKANPSGSARTAIVTVIATNVDTLTLTVTQTGLITGLEEMKTGVLLNYYPNPFPQVMTIEIANLSQKEVSVGIYSISGQRIKSLVKAQKEAKTSLVWDGTNEQGEQVPNGIYILKVNGMARQAVKGR